MVIMTISEIEDGVASGKMSAAQVFTQMRQYDGTKDLKTIRDILRGSRDRAKKISRQKQTVAIDYATGLGDAYETCVGIIDILLENR